MFSRILVTGSRNRMNLIGQFFFWLVNFFFKKLQRKIYFRFLDCRSRWPGLLRCCMYGLCGFVRTLGACFFNIIFQCINILLWAFPVFRCRLFWLCYEQISVAFFLLILILHFASHVHVLITQLLVYEFSCFFAFWVYMCIWLLALFFAESFCSASLLFFDELH